MSLVPDFDAEPVEDDSYSFIDNGIERIEDDLHTNQEEVTLPGGSSDDEVEITKDDLHNDKEAVSLQDNSNLAAKRMEDDFYGFKDNDIKRIVDNVHMNQEEVTLSGGSSDNEVEMTKDDLHNDKEAVPIPDNSNLEANPVEQVIPVVAQEMGDPFVAPPEEEIVPPFIFEDGGNTNDEEVVAMLCDDEDFLLYYERHRYNMKLPPYWSERVDVMRTMADDSGRHADELAAEYRMLMQGFIYDRELFQADQFSALAVNMIMHADEMNILSNELFVETNHHHGNLDIIFHEDVRLAILEDFELVLEDSDRLKKIALGSRRCAACLTEWVQYHQHQLGEEESEEYHQYLLGEGESEDVYTKQEEVALPLFFKEGGKNKRKQPGSMNKRQQPGSMNKRQQTICYPAGFSKFYPDLPDSLFDLPAPPLVPRATRRKHYNQKHRKNCEARKHVVMDDYYVWCMSELPGILFRRVYEMELQCDDIGVQGNELFEECERLLAPHGYFQLHHFSELAADTIAHAEALNAHSKEFVLKISEFKAEVYWMPYTSQLHVVRRHLDVVLKQCKDLDTLADVLRAFTAQLNERLAEGAEKAVPFGQEAEGVEEAGLFGQEAEGAEEAGPFAQEAEVAEEAGLFGQEDEGAEEAGPFAQEAEGAEEADELFAQEAEGAEEAGPFAQEAEGAEEAVQADLFLVAVPVEAEAAEGAGLAEHFPEEAQAEHDMWGEEDPVVPQEDQAVIIQGFPDEVVDSWEDLWVE